MILIDGSEGEGGGQILRTALTLSALTGQPFRIENIRAGRAKPGLLRQHLTALHAAAAVCGGKHADGVNLGASVLEFYPGSLRPGTYEFAVGTAGSAMLVFQTILLPLLKADAPSRVIISGGTHNPASPPFEFVAAAYLPLLRRMGADVDLKIIHYGFAPAGGGRILVDIRPLKAFSPVDLLDRGAQKQVFAEAFFANLPFDVVERELARLGELLSLAEPAQRVREVKSDGPGNALMVTVESENVTDVFTAFGRRGVRAEDVAADVAGSAQHYIASGAAVGAALADQLLLPLALAGGGSFTTTNVTPHLQTNAATIAKFLPVETICEDGERNAGAATHVSVRAE
ncbi:MAG: RNA 3'-terminal phosphate cyclase [Hyphomicrobiales bacterium]